MIFHSHTIFWDIIKILHHENYYFKCSLNLNQSKSTDYQ